MQTVLFSVTTLTGWSVNWIVWKHHQVTTHVPFWLHCVCFYVCCYSNVYITMTGILEVLYCVLIESPEVLNIIQENHIKSIISLLDKHGRNHKVGSVQQYLKHSETHHHPFTFLSSIFRSWMCSALCVCATASL